MIAGRSEAEKAGARLTTVQATSKKLKWQLLAATAVLVAGIVMFVMRLNSPAGFQDPGSLPVVLMAVGLTWYTLTRFRIWWHHK